MCAQCDNENYSLDLVDVVPFEDKNYLVVSNDLKDTLGMMINGVTFGDNYAATVVIALNPEHSGIVDGETFRAAILDGSLVPSDVNSTTIAYKDGPAFEDAETGHKTMVIGIQNGIFPSWTTMDEQRDAVMYVVDYSDVE